jgi:DNA-nicking Smr family endonuclease
MIKQHKSKENHPQGHHSQTAEHRRSGEILKAERGRNPAKEEQKNSNRFPIKNIFKVQKENTHSYLRFYAHQECLPKLKRNETVVQGKDLQ